LQKRTVVESSVGAESWRPDLPKIAATKSDTLISTRARSPGSAGMGRPRRCKSSHSVIEQHPSQLVLTGITAKTPDIVTAIARLTVRLRIESPLICEPDMPTALQREGYPIMVETSVMGVTRCRICRFEMGTRPRKRRPGTTASCRPCGRDHGGVAWWAEATLSNRSKIAGVNRGGRVGCNRSSKSVAQCISAVDR
jgi:hypothetical protein